MLAGIRSATVLGIEAYDVCVEVDVAYGLPQWTIVGLPAGEVKESSQRVRAALTNSGFDVPVRRVTISLSPGDTRKAGTGFDLPIAVGFLVAVGVVPVEAVEGFTFLGELGLDGAIRGVRGALSVARRLAGRENVRGLVLPPANVNEAGLVRSLRRRRCASSSTDLPRARSARHHLRSAMRRSTTAPTSPTSWDRKAPSARWRLLPPVDTHACSSAHPEQGRRCSRDACRPFSRR
jgi:hypothetical protein